MTEQSKPLSGAEIPHGIPLQGIPDSELMLRYKTKRDKPAFAELVRRHQKAIINFFYRICWNAALAEDMAQEVFIKLAQSAKHYKMTARFNTFLYTIARNSWRDYLRQEKYNPATASLDSPFGYDKEKTLKETIATGQKKPEEILISRETVSRIKEAVNAMKEEDRIIINLCVFQEMTYEEAAEVLDMSLGSVKSRLHYALLKLKELLKL